MHRERGETNSLDTQNHRHRWPGWLSGGAVTVGNGPPIHLEEVLRRQAGSLATLRVTVDGQPGILKAFRGRMRGIGPWQRASRGLNRLHQRQIPAPRVLAAGRARGWSGYGLLLEYLPPDQPELVPDPAGAMRVIEVVMGSLAMLHDRGLVQNDPVPSNFHPSQGRWYIIDPDRIRSYSAPLAERHAIANLCRFFVWRPTVLSAYLPEALAFYRQSRRVPLPSAFESSVIQRVEQGRRAMVRRKLRRSLSGHKYFRQGRTAHGRIVIDRRRLPETLRSAGRDLQSSWHELTAIAEADARLEIRAVSDAIRWWQKARAAVVLGLAGPEPVAFYAGHGGGQVVVLRPAPSVGLDVLDAEATTHAAAALQAMEETGLYPTPETEWQLTASGRLAVTNPESLTWTRPAGLHPLGAAWKALPDAVMERFMAIQTAREQVRSGSP